MRQFSILLFSIFSLLLTVPAQGEHSPSEKTVPLYRQIKLNFSLSNPFASSVKNNAADEQYSIEQFLEITSYVQGSFSYDEKRILFSSSETGIFNAYSMSLPEVSLDTKPIPLTNSKDSAIFALSFFPNDDRMLFQKDAHGDELNHLYLREANGTIRDLTPVSQTRVEFHGWAHDLRSFFYTTNERDPRFMDLYEMDIETFQGKRIFQNDDGFVFGCVSPNKRYLALEKIVSTERIDMYLYDKETETLANLSGQTINIENQPQAFSLDSNALYYLTNEDHDFLYVKKLNLKSQESTTEYKENWDIISFAFSHQGSYQILKVHQEAKQTAKVYHSKNKALLELPKELKNNATTLSVSRSEKSMLLSVNNETSPNNFHFYDIEKKTSQQLTQAMGPNICQAALVPAQTIRYRSRDQLAIPALYYQPKKASKTNQVPALIWVHGGPGGQSMRSYNYLIQFLVNQGYAVLAVNNRGSSGYGKTFYRLADGKHGEVDLQDCLDAKNYLIDTGVVDPEKIGIIGNSYGGYMVLAALAFHPDEMAVGIDLFGVSNWIRTLESIPSWWEVQRAMMYEKIGHPVKDRSYLIGISPLFYAHQINKPLMVLQGANDPRVLQIESDEIVEAIQASNVPYRYLVFDDEGHGFTKDRNRLFAGKAILEFLNKYLLAK